MALIGGRFAELILNRYEWHDIEARVDYKAETKIEALFGPSFWDQIHGKIVLDFGCGHGDETIAMAQRGALEVIGLDVQQHYLALARAHQAEVGVRNVRFADYVDSKVDIIVSMDSFEHFDQPNLVLREMARVLKPDGRVFASFGCPWYHPVGGHFPLFPWAHLVLTEKALMKWRSKYKTDGARRFGEVAGGLNQMSIRRFERLVAASPLRFETFKTIPIRAVRSLHCRLTREFFTSFVRCTLVHRMD
jgi:SAM-dependent methyltransferase